MSRSVTLVLCTASEVLGSLPPFPVAFPFWPSVDGVLAGSRELHGIDPVILRILCTPADATAGGDVVYLAQVDRPPAVALQPWTGPDPLAEHPRRAWYARPGAWPAALSWADAALIRCGRPRVGKPEQIKTWNLSCIWRLPTAHSPTWLKLVPPMFGHEGSLIGRLDPRSVPTVLDAADGRLLMADIPGEDQYDATGEPLAEMLTSVTALHRDWARRIDELLILGLHDRRLTATPARIEEVFERHADELAPDVRRQVRRLVDGLPRRAAELVSCGLPDTLVHGDFHPGNVRGRPGAFVILDWGDAFVGNPALDWIRLSEWIPAADRAALEPVWVRHWQQAAPGCDPVRAATLIRPYARLLGAVTYQGFLDQIEPDEYPYHANDPRNCLIAAAGAG